MLISYGEDYIPRDISLVLDVNNKFKTLVAADLVNISLTSREEYIAFYEREYKRLGGVRCMYGVLMRKWGLIALVLFTISKRFIS